MKIFKSCREEALIFGEIEREGNKLPALMKDKPRVAAIYAYGRPYRAFQGSNHNHCGNML